MALRKPESRWTRTHARSGRPSCLWQLGAGLAWVALVGSGCQPGQLGSQPSPADGAGDPRSDHPDGPPANDGPPTADDPPGADPTLPPADPTGDPGSLHPCGANLVLNGGFEDGPSATFAGLGVSWESNDGAAHPGYHQLDSETKFSGGYAQKIDTHGEWDHYPARQVSGYGTVTPGQTLRLSAMIKATGNDNPAAWYVIGMWWFNNDVRVPGESEVKNPIPDTNNYDWQEIRFEAVAPAEANRAAVFLTAHYHGVVWYDDIVLCALVE